MIPCPICRGRSQVVYSRFNNGTIRRRRKCQTTQCGYVWVTYEVSDKIVGFVRKAIKLMDDLKLAAEDFGIDELDRLPKPRKQRGGVEDYE